MEGQKAFPTVGWSIGQAVGVIRQMPILFLLASIGTAVMSVISLSALPENPKDLDEVWNADRLFPAAISSVFSAAILTPMIIATHRLVILGEVTKLFSRDLLNRRFVHFFWLSFVFQAMLFATGIPTALFGFHFLPVIMMIVLMIVSTWLAMRIILVFPAAAVDAPGATLQNAFSDSRGEAWGIFATLLVIGLLLALINMGVALLTQAIALTGAVAIAGLLRILSNAILQVASAISLAAAASYIYQGMAQKLKAAPG